MESTRFFVANLPVNTIEKDLQYLFQDYGEIKSIDLKTKENLVDPNDVKIIAFVTLNIERNNIQYCLKDLNWRKVHGQNIKVSLAKESFLERLKREREEAKSCNDGPTPQESKQLFEPQIYLSNVPRQNKRKTFDIDAELEEGDEVAPELMISKKRAAASMHNGKIVIQAHDVEPIHIIENSQKKKTQLDDKSNNADRKRKESLNKMKNQYEQKKSAIQQALQSMGGEKLQSKKIKFSDAESDQEDNQPVKKTNIFGSDDDIEDDNMNLKSVLLGKKGEKLAKMRAEQNIDPRFHIDEKFVDDDDEDNEKDQNDKDDVNDERQWQMNILEQVVGTKMSTVNDMDKFHKNKKMLRYDPSKDDHKKFERKLEQENPSKKSKNKKTKNESEKNIPANPTEVSKEVFYVVTDTLQQSLRSRGEGFSLLNMFGRNEQLEERDERLKQLGSEKILVNNNKLEKTFAINPFSYDSSSESEEEKVVNEQENIDLKAETNGMLENKSKKKVQIATESFFISKNDIRLKEGAKFFTYKKSDDATFENYEEVRNRLKLLIKSKILKTKKNLLNAGYKGKRKL